MNKICRVNWVMVLYIVYVFMKEIDIMKNINSDVKFNRFLINIEWYVLNK